MVETVKGFRGSELDLAMWTGLTPRTVRQYVTDGLFVRLPGGGFELVSCVNAYIASLRTAASGRATKTQESKTRLIEAQAATAEAKAKLLTGRYLDVAEVETRWIAIGRALRAALMAIPSRVASRLGFSLEVVDELDRELRAALAEISERGYEAGA